jgi:hypothetical protein
VLASKDAIPLELILDCVVIAPVVAFLLIDVKPPSDRTGPEKVVLAISISLSWQMSKLILRQGFFYYTQKRAVCNCPFIFN